MQKLRTSFAIASLVGIFVLVGTGCEPPIDANSCASIPAIPKSVTLNHSFATQMLPQRYLISVAGTVVAHLIDSDNFGRHELNLTTVERQRIAEAEQNLGFTDSTAKVLSCDGTLLGTIRGKTNTKKGLMIRTEYSVEDANGTVLATSAPVGLNKTEPTFLSGDSYLLIQMLQAGVTIPDTSLVDARVAAFLPAFKFNFERIFDTSLKFPSTTP